LALLLHFGATESEALSWYQGFKEEVIAPLKDEQTGQYAGKGGWREVEAREDYN